jgi:tetratricopeptide (TPR) repeat protein
MILFYGLGHVKPRAVLLLLIWIASPSDLISEPQTWEAQVLEDLHRGHLDSARNLAQQALQNPASAGTAQEFLGRIAIAEKHYEDALSHLNLAQSMGRASPELHEAMAAALQRLGRYEEALPVLEEELRRNPTRVDLRYQLAESLLALDRIREAQPHLEAVYEQGLRHAGVLMQLARARFASGQDDRAADLLELAASHSSSANLLFQIGRLLFDNLLYSQSVKALVKAWEQQPGSFEVGMFLALAHFQLEQYEECNQILKEIKSSAESLEFHNLRGSVYARLGRWNDAAREFQIAVTQWPDRADGYLNQGLFYLEQNDLKRAQEALEKGAKLMAPGSKIFYTTNPQGNCQGLAPYQAEVDGNKLQGSLFANLADALHKRQHYVTALQVYLLVLRIDDHNPKAHGGIGLICQELGNSKEGESFLIRGIELYRDNPELHYYLGSAQYALGKYADALSSYARAIELEKPEVPALHWVHLGIAQLSGDSLAESEKSFLQALQRDPNLAMAHYELGKLYLMRREFDKAEQSLERAVQLDPRQLGAYYQYGQACIRNGKREKGEALLATFERKKALRASAKRYGSMELLQR